MIASDQLVAPATLEEAGLSLDLVSQLTLKTLFFFGEYTGSGLAHRLGVTLGVIEPALEFLKSQRHCEIVSGDFVGSSSYRYRITVDGRAAAGLHLQQNQYVGVAPVPLAQYQKYLKNQSPSSAISVTRDQVEQEFSNMVIGPAVLEEIGVGLNGGKSVFIYGPPGNGKTTIARALRNLLGGDVEVPHAVEVEGSIIRVFDPVTHEEQVMPDDDQLTIVSSGQKDRRWATCRRPMVSVGGELALESLDLSFEPRSGFYRAPLQMIANGGMLLIDDFGRQRCSPQDLLNRWMVPLESGMDHLKLQSGVTFEVPFQVFVAFSTNIRPSELVDEAFLRRVRCKVLAESPTAEQFIRIFEAYCQERDVPFDHALVEQLLDGYFHDHGVALRACQPRDLITQALTLASYRGDPRELTIELLEAACAGYFVLDEE